MYHTLTEKSANIDSVGNCQWGGPIHETEVLADIKTALVATLENDKALKAAFAEYGTEVSRYSVIPAPIGS